MSSEKKASPFAALSYQEQQDRWLEWRSRQLEFQEGNVVESKTDQKKSAEPFVPPVQLPHFQQAAPTRHQNLDQVLSRISQAEKRLGAFQQPTSNPSNP